MAFPHRLSLGSHQLSANCFNRMPQAKTRCTSLPRFLKAQPRPLHQAHIHIHTLRRFGRRPGKYVSKLPKKKPLNDVATIAPHIGHPMPNSPNTANSSTQQANHCSPRYCNTANTCHATLQGPIPHSALSKAAIGPISSQAHSQPSNHPGQSMVLSILRKTPQSPASPSHHGPAMTLPKTPNKAPVHE